jgi:hypothetical protein
LSLLGETGLCDHVLRENEKEKEAEDLATYVFAIPYKNFKDNLKCMR